MLSRVLESKIFDSAVILSPPYDPLDEISTLIVDVVIVDRTEDLE